MKLITFGEPGDTFGLLKEFGGIEISSSEESEKWNRHYFYISGRKVTLLIIAQLKALRRLCFCILYYSHNKANT